MGRLKDQIGSYIHKRKITSLTDETKQLIEKIVNPTIEQQIEDSHRVDELYRKIQRVVELDTRKQMGQVDRKLDSLNEQLISSTDTSKRM